MRCNGRPLYLRDLLLPLVLGTAFALFADKTAILFLHAKDPWFSACVAWILISPIIAFAATNYNAFPYKCATFHSCRLFWRTVLLLDIFLIIWLRIKFQQDFNSGRIQNKPDNSVLTELFIKDGINSKRPGDLTRSVEQRFHCSSSKRPKIGARKFGGSKKDESCLQKIIKNAQAILRDMEMVFLVTLFAAVISLK